MKIDKLQGSPYPQYDSVTAHLRPKNYRKISGHSMTIPDQSMPLRTILERYSRGIPIHGMAGQPIYDDNELPDPRYMDLADREAMSNQFKKELKEMEELQKKQLKAEREKTREQIRKEVEAEMKAAAESQNQVQPDKKD